MGHFSYSEVVVMALANQYTYAKRGGYYWAYQLGPRMYSNEPAHTTGKEFMQQELYWPLFPS